MKTSYILFLCLVALASTKNEKFLAGGKLKEGSKLSFEIVEENKAKITRYQAKPDSIIPGGSLDFKMQFEALESFHAKELFLETFNNDVSIFQDHVNIEKDYTVGSKDVTGYTTSIPSFCPSGTWDIYLNVLDSDGGKICVLKAHFDV